MAEGIRICVHFCVHMHKGILKEHPSVVEACGSLVDRGKSWEDRVLLFISIFFCFMKQQKVLSVQKTKLKNKMWIGIPILMQLICLRSI